jgi:hypothetical protein
MVEVVEWASDELIQVAVKLSDQQWAGIVRIVQAKLRGRTLSSLLDCKDQICTSTTFYGSGERKGWRDNPDFMAAWELAKRDYRKWLLESGTGEALAILSNTAPDAAREIRQQVIGDQEAIVVLVKALNDPNYMIRRLAAESLGKTGSPIAVKALSEALETEKAKSVRGSIVEALSEIASWHNASRLAAAGSVLDRVGVETAQKFKFDDDDINSAIERELARLAGSGSSPTTAGAAGDANA